MFSVSRPSLNACSRFSVNISEARGTTGTIGNTEFFILMVRRS